MLAEQRASVAYAVALFALTSAFVCGLICRVEWMMWIFGPLALLAAFVGLMCGLPRDGRGISRSR